MALGFQFNYGVLPAHGWRSQFKTPFKGPYAVCMTWRSTVFLCQSQREKLGAGGTQHFFHAVSLDLLVTFYTTFSPLPLSHHFFFTSFLFMLLHLSSVQIMDIKQHQTFDLLIANIFLGSQVQGYIMGLEIGNLSLYFVSQALFLGALLLSDKKCVCTFSFFFFW